MKPTSGTSVHCSLYHCRPTTTSLVWVVARRPRGPRRCLWLCALCSIEAASIERDRVEDELNVLCQKKARSDPIMSDVVGLSLSAMP